MGANRRDQLVVDGDRHIVVKQRSINGAGMMANAGRIDVAFVGAGERGGERVGMGLVLGIVLVKGRLPNVARCVVEQRDEGGVRQFHLLLPAGGDAAKLQVSVGELAEDLVRRAGKGALHRQQFLLRLREDVRTRAYKPLEQQAVGREHRQIHPGGQHAGRDPHDFRHHETGLLAGQRADVLEAAGHPLGLGRPLVLAGTQVRVGAKPVTLAVVGDVEGKAFGEPLRR